MDSVRSNCAKAAWVQVRRVVHVAGAGVVLLLICSPAFAQLNLGRIFGIISDTSGGAVVGATVTITDVARSVSRTLTADSTGAYSASSLTPGIYAVHAAFRGFKTVDQQNVIVGVGQDVRIDLTLQPGEQSQTVIVTDAPPMVNTTNSVLSTMVETQSIAELPLNGRLYTKLLDFTPGITGNPGGATPTYSSNGAAPQTQDWMLDGVEDTNAVASSGPLIGAATSTDELTVLPLDSIQEVAIMANPPAQFGWQQGAVVNVGLKSGTNTIHGSAYAYGRDSALDAKNPFLAGPPALPKADDYFEQFGASIGGPIKKDRLFYFGNFEGMRYIVGSPSSIQVPSSANLGGDPANGFPDAIVALQDHGVTPSQLSLNLAGCTLTSGAPSCDPTKGLFRNGSTNTQALPSALDNVGGSNNLVVKMDYHPNDRNSINGEYFFGNANDNSSGNGVQPWWVNGNHNRVQAVRGVWVYIPNSTWVNEARFGYDRYNLVDYNAECTQKLGQPNYAADFGFISGANPPSPVCGFPVVNIAGFTQLGAGGGVNDQLVFQNTYHFVDSISYNRGNHQIKFGGEFHHTLYRGYGVPGNFDGTIQFFGGNAFTGSTPLEDFLGGLASTGALLVGEVPANAGFNRYGGFVQDDWRLTRRFTLNLGLRYEYEPPVVESNNAFGNFDPNSPTGMVQQTNGNALYKTDHRDFGPRVGFAWDITGKGTTVLRAGSGIGYDTSPLGALLTSTGANLPAIPTGFTLYDANGNVVPATGTIRYGQVSLTGAQLNWAVNQPVFQTGPSALACGNGLGTNPPPCNLLAKAPNFPRSYLVTWTISLQHAFTNNLSLNTAYVGTHTSEMPQLINVNQPALGTVGNEQIRQPYYNKFPWLGQVFVFSPVGFANYNGLQMSLIQRASHGLTLTADYSFSHSVGTQFDDFFAFVQDSTHPNAWYSNSEVTPRHHVGLELTYDMPGKKGPGQFLEGWELNSIVNMLSAAPFDAADAADDFAGVGNGTGVAGMIGETWTLIGKPGDFDKMGRLATTPCFGVTGSVFGSASNCTQVSSLANMPAACLRAATNEPTNAAMNAANRGSSSGLASLANFGCYMMGKSVILPPPQGTFGNMNRSILLGSPFREWDMSVTKTWKFGERMSTQFRAEFFNVLNAREFAPPNPNINVPSVFGVSLAVPNFNNPINGTGGAREVQVGLKILF